MSEQRLKPAADYFAQPPLRLAAYRERVGQIIGTSRWITIDQSMIDAFADVTGDHQAIHVDPAEAAKTPFGGTIAHGFLTLSLLGSLGPATIPPLEGQTGGLNYGLDRLRFVSPVRSGSRVRAVFTLKSLEERSPGQYVKRLDVTVEVEGAAKPAVAVEWIIVALVAGA